ncbi:DegT/DnrJ/EryC1/StrS family aminotransferase [Coprobacter tertius]|uniref:DegT/DnrJ/EryC1/StrS family aminotransferase n=1 Tax=Coprobacter tertius TaxID=2944915 RepID=A0ABT1MJR5_9BACT|nr:DegT/DnrJ/EryC1/StrS family aminotransferase [Coprobacter tertius]MCP9612676.1 DegT/DnrJ/EryC1/StrS family aminotransferase [Coprobacter tertius]
MKFFNLQKINARYASELKKVAEEVIDSGWYLQGDRVAAFEKSLAEYVGCRYAVTVGNGLDALRLILKAYIEMGIMAEGDEIIVPANTFIASVLAITDNRLVPVFAEPDENTFNLDFSHIESLITPRTRAIMIVHLYGRSCWGAGLVELARKYNLKIIEDNAQAMGALGKVEDLGDSVHTGALGDAAGISFYPTKNLGALGDSGAITTDDDRLAEIVRSLGNYGSGKKYYNEYQGLNSRMDEIQAAFLSVKLKYLDEMNACRNRLADMYSEAIDIPDVILPQAGGKGEHVWHQYVIRTTCRNALQSYLQNEGIATQIHYPVPPHKQNCYREYNSLVFPITEKLSREVLSLPISPEMSESDIDRVSGVINRFFKQRN